MVINFLFYRLVMKIGSCDKDQYAEKIAYLNLFLLLLFYEAKL